MRPHACTISLAPTAVLLMCALLCRDNPGRRALFCSSMPEARTLPAIVRRRSKVHGWGVFAKVPITKNSRIVTYDGELIDHKESFKRESKYLKRGEIWCFTV